ncbi:alpha/beta hydrolase family protein [Streptomyces sp. NPDC050504]|uniref:alpha/beta hydrolase family protein n=1 Tax=Streptomyces sp. NPDC050504 TaxID=3365618 RepID=UPI0037AEBE99
MPTPNGSSRTAALGCALALLLPLTLAATASAYPSAPPDATTSAARPERPATGPRLPAPTGPHAVGSSTLHLVDRSRPDPWVPDADGRELMVTMYYPAAEPGGGRPAPYATTAEVELMMKGFGMTGVEPAEVSGLRTNSRVDARPAKGRHPLVVLSPGFGASRYTLTHIAEDLASRGYVVASVDHAYESLGTAMPDGRMLTCVACVAVDENGVDPGVLTAARAADVSFLLDRLTRPHPGWRYSDVIDRRRVGMAGHSIGGASAATAMVGDRRVRAGINMDGAFWDALPPQGLDGRPFMMLGTETDHLPGGPDKTWDTTWPGLGGWKRWLTVAGSEHFTFSDKPVYDDRFGLPHSPLPPERAVALTRDYVAAFFDRHLRGRPQPLLDGPSASNPEVRFHRPQS